MIELADELSLEKCFESFRNYISESLGILFTSQSLHRFGKDHAGILESFRWFCDENIVLGASCHLGVVAVSWGVELRGVVVTILSLQFWNT